VTGVTGRIAVRAATLALAGALAGSILLFSQSFTLCFPPPKLAGLAVLTGFAAAFALAAGLVPAAARLPFTPPLLAVLGWSAAGLARSRSPEAFGTVFTTLAAAAAAAWLAGALAAREAERNRLTSAFVLAHLGCGLYGAAQYLGWDPWTWTLDYGRGRVFSTLGNPNFLAGQLALALPVLAALGMKPDNPPPGGGVLKWLARAAFAAALMSFVCAQTRGAWIGLIAGCAVAAAAGRRAFALRPRSVTWLLAALVAGGIVFSIPSLNPTGISIPRSLASSTNLDQQSARQRFFWWQAAALLCRAAPVAGQGLANFAREFPARARGVSAPYCDLPPAFGDHPHNDYLFILCEHGVIGLGLLFWLGAVGLRCSWLAARRGEPLGAGILAGAIALCVHAVWNMPSTIQATLMTSGFLLGLATPEAGVVGVAPDVATPRAREPRRPAVVLAVGLIVALIFAWRPAVLLTAQAYHNGARILHENRQEAPAAWLCRLTLRLTNAPWRTHFLLGSIFYGEHYWNEARAAFREDEAENPWGADAILHQGKALRELGRYDEADAECRRALKVVPNYADAATAIASLSYYRALNEKQAGRTAAMRPHLRHARVWLNYALAFFPRHAEALKLLGFVEAMDGRWAAARDAWVRSIRARPTDDDLRRKLELLEADLPRLLRGGKPR